MQHHRQCRQLSQWFCRFLLLPSSLLSPLSLLRGLLTGRRGKEEEEEGNFFSCPGLKYERRREGGIFYPLKNWGSAPSPLSASSASHFFLAASACQSLLFPFGRSGRKGMPDEANPALAVGRVSSGAIWQRRRLQALSAASGAMMHTWVGTGERR